MNDMPVKRKNVLQQGLHKTQPLIGQIYHKNVRRRIKKESRQSKFSLAKFQQKI
jgi:hypothetical protein